MSYVSRENHWPEPHKAALIRLGALALEIHDLSDLLHGAAALLAETLAVDFCKILELLPDGENSLLRAGVGWREGLVGQAVMPVGSGTLAGHALLTKAPVIVEDLRAETRFPDSSLLLDHGVTSGVSLLIPGAEPFGILGLHSSARRAFSGQELEFLEEAAGILGRAIQRHRTHEAVRQSEEQFRCTFEDSPIGMTLGGFACPFLRANRVVCTMLGYTEEEFKQLTFDDITHPDDLAGTRHQAVKLLSGEIPHFQVEQRILAKGGEPVPVRLTATLVRDGHGRPLHAVAMFEDLTEQRRRDRDLRVARFTVAHAQEGIFWAGADGRYRDANESALRMLGYSREELLAMGIPDIDENVAAEDWPRLWGELTRRGSAAMETRVRRKTLPSLPVELTVNYWAINGEAYVCTFARDISERKRAEEELQASEERYRSLFENAAAMVWTMDLDGNLTAVNKPAERFSGYSREELVGKNITELLPPDQHDSVRAMMERSPQEGGTATFDLDVVAKDGQRRPVQITARLLRRNGKPAGIQGIGIDVSVQRQVQEALRRSEERFRAVIENSQDLITILDAGGTVLYVSPSIEQMLGYKSEERIGQNSFDIIHPHDVAAVREALAGGRETPGATAALEYRVRHKDGSWRHIEAVARNLLENPAVSGIVVSSRDITARKLAEERLRASEEWFRSSFEHSAIPTSISSLNGRLLRANAALCRFLGRSEEELQGLSWTGFTHPDDIESGRAASERLSSEQAPFVQTEKRYIHKDGGVLWGALTISPIRDAKGRPEGVVAQVIDITRRKQAEEELRQSEQRFRVAAELTSDFICEWDVKSGRLEWFGEVDRCLEYPPGGFPRTIDAWKESIHPEDRHRVSAALERVLKGVPGPADLEFRITTRNGSYRHWLGRGRCLRDPSGQVYKWIGASTDVAERKEVELNLLRSQAELRALAGRLLSGEEDWHRNLARELHDDFNQRLASVGFDLAVLRAECPPDASDRLKERLIGAQARLAAVSEDLRWLSHRIHPALVELLGLPAALRELCRDVSRQGGFPVRFQGRKLPESTSGDVALCLYRVAQECLRNTILHARAGRVTVVLSGADQSLRLTVRDDGVGFDPDAPASRKGLGLISMRERVSLARGRLSIESRPGKGTRVVVEVPLSSPCQEGGL